MRVSVQLLTEADPLSIEELERHIAAFDSMRRRLKNRRKANPALNLNIVLASGDSISLLVRANTRIHALTKSVSVALALGPTPDIAVSLVHAEQILEGEKTVDESGILDGGTVAVVLQRMEGNRMAAAARILKIQEQWSEVARLESTTRVLQQTQEHLLTELVESLRVLHARKRGQHVSSYDKVD